MARTSVQPLVEASTQDAAERAKQSAFSLAEEASRPAASRATWALGAGIIAILLAAAALANFIFKLF
ncbi:MAG: hypothetical protein U1F42_08625 [Candidatus Competibacteraceae bacterium]